MRIFVLLVLLTWATQLYWLKQEIWDVGCGKYSIAHIQMIREHLGSEEGSKMTVFVVPCSNLVLVF